MTTTATDSRPLLSSRAAAARLGISVWTLYRLVDGGRLAAVRLTETGPLRFQPEAIENLIREAMTQ